MANIIVNRSPYNAISTRSKGPTPRSASHDGGTLQTQFIKGQEERQVKNSAGGVGYALDPWKQIERFLVLGTEGGTYYASEAKLTRENAKVVEALIHEDGVRVVNTVVDFSENNRAPKADPSLFVLALAISVGDLPTKRAVHAALPRVARIGTHIFSFVEFAQQFRGWGRALRECVASWYLRHEAYS